MRANEGMPLYKCPFRLTVKSLNPWKTGYLMCANLTEPKGDGFFIFRLSHTKLSVVRKIDREEIILCFFFSSEFDTKKKTVGKKVMI